MNILLRILTFLAIVLALLAVLMGIGVLAQPTMLFGRSGTLLLLSALLASFAVWGRRTQRSRWETMSGPQKTLVSIALLLFLAASSSGLKLALSGGMLVLALGILGLSIWALVDCGRRLNAAQENMRTTWVVWILVILFAPGIGALVYLFVNHFGQNPATPASTPPNPPPHVFKQAFDGIFQGPQPPPSVSPQPTNRPKGQCPKCGAPLAPDAPEGLCPRCLLQMNLAAPTQFPGAAAAATSFTTAAPPPPPPVEEIGKHFPQLEILECLGRGGMGVVYKARQPRLNRLVALKILAPGRQNDAQFAERFLREAQALAKLNHPNIVTVYDFGESDGLYYLLMEYVDGVTLRALEHGGKIEATQALAIVPRICEALQYAHEQGVVHRDIKPENVLLDKQGRVKIADFGIARMLGVEGQPEHTRDRYVIGTPYYMAPEQVEHPLEVDHRADIYSLGVVFYEMLTGELPLGRFASPSQKVQVDVRLDDVVLRALEKEPQRRYQQAGEVKSDVETISGGGTGGLAAAVAAPPHTPAPPRGPTAAPPPPPVPDLSSGLDAVYLPGTALCFVGIILVVYAVWGLVAGVMAKNYILVLVDGICGITIICGAKNMKRLERHSLAVLAAVLAFGLNGFAVLSTGAWRNASSVEGLLALASAGIGIWAFVVLNRRDIIAAFAAKARHAETAAAAAPRSSWGMRIFKTLAVIFLIGALAVVVAVMTWNTARPTPPKLESRQEQIEHTLETTMQKQMTDLKIRYSPPNMQWAQGVDVANITLTDAEQLQQANGQNKWVPIDGSLRAIFVGNETWIVEGEGGDGPLADVDFSVQAPDLGGSHLGQPFTTNQSRGLTALEEQVFAAIQRLDKVKELYLTGGATRQEFDDATKALNDLKEQEKSDPLLVAYRRLGAAQRRLDYDDALQRLQVISEADVEKAQDEVRTREAQVAEASRNEPSASGQDTSLGQLPRRGGFGGFGTMPASASAAASPPSPPVTPPTGAELDALKIQLQAAQTELDAVNQQFIAGQVTQLAVIDASEKVDVLKAQMTGDPMQVARARLPWAQKRLSLVSQLYQAGLATQAEYAQAESEYRSLAVSTGNAPPSRRGRGAPSPAPAPAADTGP